VGHLVKTIIKNVIRGHNDKQYILGKNQQLFEKEVLLKKLLELSTGNNKQVIKEDSTSAGHVDFPVGFN